MNIELLPGLTNVIRFPVEDVVRPSMDLIFEIEPDVQEVMQAAEAFRFDDVHHGLKNAVDQETAVYIAEQILPAGQEELKAGLDALLDPVVERAVAACRAANGAAVQAVAAQTKAHAAKVEGGCWLAPLEERATALTEHAARQLIEAHNRCEEAHGVYRAVGFARRDEPWRPYDSREEEDLFIQSVEAWRARKARINPPPAAQDGARPGGAPV